MTRAAEREIRRIVRDEIARWWVRQCAPVRRMHAEFEKAGLIPIDGVRWEVREKKRSKPPCKTKPAIGQLRHGHKT